MTQNLAHNIRQHYEAPILNQFQNHIASQAHSLQSLTILADQGHKATIS